MFRIPSSLANLRAIVPLFFGVLALLPLMGINHITWAQLVNFIFVSAGLLVLFLKYRPRISVDSEARAANLLDNPAWLRIIAFLYFIFIFLVFFPSGISFFDTTVILFFVLLCLLSLIQLFLAQFVNRAGRFVLRSLSPPDTIILVSVFFFCNMVILSNGISVENGVRAVGTAILLDLFYLLISSNISFFVPGPLKFSSLLPYWMLTIAILSGLIGLVHVFNSVNLRYQAHAGFSQGDFSGSALKFIEFEEKNQFQFSLNRKDIYPRLAQELLSKDATQHADMVTFFLDSVVELIDPQNTDSDLKESLYQNYLDLGEVYSAFGQYEMARSTYAKAVVFLDDPVLMLGHFRQLHPDLIEEIWGGVPFATLQDFERVDTVQFYPWALGWGWSQRITSHQLTSDISRSGSQSEFLAIDYSVSPDLTAKKDDSHLIQGHLYDYWAMSTAISRPPFPLGIRISIRGEKDGKQIPICLVVNYQTGKTSGVIRSGIVTLSEEWSVISVQGLHNTPDAAYFDQIAISFLGPIGGPNMQHGRIYIDDVQVFTYFE
jgi:hypothetical protein